MVRNERELARAIQGKESRIELHDKLKSGVEKIKEPSSVVWVSVAAALLSSVFFWGSPSAFTLGLIVGLPAILAVCGGVGGIVFVTLGASGTVCAFRLLMSAHTIDVLNSLRNDYDLNGNILTRKR